MSPCQSKGEREGERDGEGERLQSEGRLKHSSVNQVIDPRPGCCTFAHRPRTGGQDRNTKSEADVDTVVNREMARKQRKVLLITKCNARRGIDPDLSVSGMVVQGCSGSDNAPSWALGTGGHCWSEELSSFIARLFPERCQLQVPNSFYHPLREHQKFTSFPPQDVSTLD